MNLYDIIAEHGKGKGEKVMWQTVRAISDYIEEHEEVLDDSGELYCKLYGLLFGPHFDKEYAEEAIESMFFTDKNGVKKYAPYWTEELMHDVYENIHHLIPGSYTEHDVWVVLNMLKSDYGTLLESWFPGHVDEKVIEMAVSYLNDPDAKNKDSKIWSYLMKA